MRALLNLLTFIFSVAWGAYAQSGWVAILPNPELQGWQVDGAPKFQFENGLLVFEGESRGRLLTKRTYRNCIVRVEFRNSPGANHGIALRAPLGWQASRYGMEIQILDDFTADPARVGNRSRCGAIYGVVPVRFSAVRPPGQWNTMTITCQERQVKVELNGLTVVDVNLNSIHDVALLRDRPGFLQEEGHIGFVAHSGRVEFRKLDIRELPTPKRRLNEPPAGFVALFNGRDLSGWQSWYANPPEIATLPEEERRRLQEEANRQHLRHWSVENGELVFDGKGVSLLTQHKYRNFELILEWQIPPGGDSGIYLRGVPQVQIWDRPEGSGGLYNNERSPNKPLTRADRPPGQWNRFHILMLDGSVYVWLNGVLVVNNIPLENYWNREQPLPEQGPIWLQAHGSPLRFRNLFLREIGKTVD